MYEGQNYQALNIGYCYGYLKKVEIKQLDSLEIYEHDLVLLNNLPQDLPVTSGIICSEFQNVLSHINVLSRNRKTPNISLKNAWKNPILANLVGQLVYFKASNDSFTIRKANLQEASNYWSQKRKQNVLFIARNIVAEEFIIESEATNLTNIISGKASNFMQLKNMEGIPVPENSFAIPFYYYHKHLADNGIDTLIQRMMANKNFNNDQYRRKQALLAIQRKIKSAPINSNFKKMVLNQINNFEDFDSYKFRSSTNTEDLITFSGAGLYDSYGAKKGDNTKTIENAIKKVWASLWNFRAYEEREHYHIDHNLVQMGILVHRSFPHEDANGVVVTKNIFNVNHGYVVNVQHKEISTVQPEANTTCDQIIIYTINLINNTYTFEYLNESNVPELKSKPVLTNTELQELANYCTTIKKYFHSQSNLGATKDYNQFGVEIEFKVDSKIDDRRLYIKQVRIY